MYLVDNLAANAGRVVLPNVGLNESSLLVFNKLKHLRNTMEDVADQTMSRIRDPVIASLRLFRALKILLVICRQVQFSLRV